MARRLAMIKTCAVCAAQCRPHDADSKTCSRQCGNIRRSRMSRPEQVKAMHHCNAVKRARFDAALAGKLAGLTLVQAYRLGERRGANRVHDSRQRRAA